MRAHLVSYTQVTVFVRDGDLPNMYLMKKSWSRKRGSRSCMRIMPVLRAFGVMFLDPRNFVNWFYSLMAVRLCQSYAHRAFGEVRRYGKSFGNRRIEIAGKSGRGDVVILVRHTSTQA